MGSYSGPEINDPSLILTYDAANTKSYPGSGTTWTNITGSGTNGTLTNSPTFSTAKGGSLVFNGTNSNIQMGNASTFVPTAAITVSVWAYSTVVGVYKKMFVTVTAGTSTIDGIYMSIGPSPYHSYFGIGTAAGGNVSAGYGTALSVNTWYNFCGTYNGTTITYYVNGISVGTAAQSGAIKNAGVGRISGYDNNNETWSGNIANFYMWNRALSATEVLQNYNALKWRFV